MIFLKLGGSLISDKAKPETPRLEVMQRLAEEIAAVVRRQPELRLLLGHGSGSFGHRAAAKHGTHRGAVSRSDWSGFAEVWATANRLNRLLVDALRSAGLPVISFPPSASAVSDSGEIITMALEPIQRALGNGLLPLVQGDVGFDRARGSVILSTEAIFRHLAPALRPKLVLLAGSEPGVMRDPQAGAEIVPLLDEEAAQRIGLASAADIDVTGGMADKVRQAFLIARAVPGVVVRIFSGAEPGAVQRALLGEPLGTWIRATAE